jgi:phasin
MTDPKLTMEVPPAVREMAEKSVVQAEKAVSAFMESAGKSITMVPGPMSDVAKQALQITDKNLKASFDHARKLMQAKDINEVMQLQSEFLRSLYGVMTDQFKQATGGASAAVDNDSKEKPDLI